MNVSELIYALSDPRIDQKADVVFDIGYWGYGEGDQIEIGGVEASSNADGDIVLLGNSA